VVSGPPPPGVTVPRVAVTKEVGGADGAIVVAEVDDVVENA
jgi:hypothetical protein